MDALLEKGHVPRGYLGVGVQPVAVPEALRTILSLPNQTGVMVVGVEPGGPVNLEGIEDLQSFSDSGVIGKPVKVRVIRAGGVNELEITVGERPER
jgi:S1-C subfamily serine protease